MVSKNCYDKLDYIAKLDKNWNGYDADPISRGVIDNCKNIINQINHFPEIYPTANDSIQLEYKTDKMYIELEVFLNKYKLFVCNHYGDRAGMDIKSLNKVAQWWNLLTSIAINY